MATLSQLRAFLEAAQCGSFVRASDRLNLSQTSVSARIKALESELGTRLFHRRKYGVELNQAGMGFRPYAENAVISWEKGKQSVRDIAAGNVPILAGIQQDLWEVFAAAWFRHLKQAMPSVQLRLESAHSDSLCDRVARGLLDLAIVFMPKRQRGVTLTELTQFSVILVSSQPGQFNGRLPADYYYIDWGNPFESWHDDHFGVDIDSALSVGVSGIGLSAIKHNGGAAYLLAPVVTSQIKNGELYQIEQAPVFEVDVFVATRRQPVTDKNLNLFIDEIKNATRQVVTA